MLGMWLLCKREFMLAYSKTACSQTVLFLIHIYNKHRRDKFLKFKFLSELTV